MKSPITFPTSEFLAEYLRNRQPDVKWVDGHNTYCPETHTTGVEKFKYDTHRNYSNVSNAYRMEFILQEICCIEFDDEEECENWCINHDIPYYYDSMWVRTNGEDMYCASHVRQNDIVIRPFTIIQ